MEITKADIDKMEFLLVEGIKSSDIDFLDKTIHDDLLCIRFLSWIIFICIFLMCALMCFKIYLADKFIKVENKEESPSFTIYLLFMLPANFIYTYTIKQLRVIKLLNWSNNVLVILFFILLILMVVTAIFFDGNFTITL